MIEFYIVPLEVKPGDLRDPKYLDQIESYPAKIAGAYPIGNYFLLKINSLEQALFDYLDSLSDVMKVSQGVIASGLNRLRQLGMDTTGLNANSPIDEIERRVVEFLTGNIQTFSEAFGTNGE